MRASMRRHPAGKGRLTLAVAAQAPPDEPPPCNDCGDPSTIQHRTGTSNGQAFYIWLCEPCERECNREWEVKRRG